MTTPNLDRTDNAIINKTCPCDSGFYDDGVNLKCAVCNFTCKSCNGSTKNNCTSCPTGVFRDN